MLLYMALPVWIGIWMAMILSIGCTSKAARRFRFTNTSKGSTTTARFTPDGKYISYLSKRQLYLLPVDGGAPIQITNEKSGIGNYQVSPDGKLITFLKREEETGTEKWYTEPATPGH